MISTDNLPSWPPASTTPIKVWQLPLTPFIAGISEQTVNVSIENNAYVFYFQLNPIEGNLFLSVTGANQSPIYFGSYRCVFGTYINLLDAGFPYLIFFVDTTNNGYEGITFDNLNNGVNMYVRPR
jgi:hypothetical protein